MTRLAPLVVGLALALVPGRAAAAPPDKAACADAYTAGQELRLERHYTRARKALLACAQPTCPAFMQTECTRWLSEVEAAQSSIVVVVRDDAGHDVKPSRVVVDGEDVREPLDGRALAVDPGEHVVEVHTPDATRSERVLVREGEKRRPLAFTVAAAPPAAAPPPVKIEPRASRRPIPTLGWILGGTSALALASFAGFATAGFVMQSDRDATCSPHCPQADVDAVKRRYLVADISLGVAVLAAAGFGWVILARPGPDPQVALVRRF